MSSTECLIELDNCEFKKYNLKTNDTINYFNYIPTSEITILITQLVLWFIIWCYKLYIFVDHDVLMFLVLLVNLVMLSVVTFVIFVLCIVATCKRTTFESIVLFFITSTVTLLLCYILYYFNGGLLDDGILYIMYFFGLILCELCIPPRNNDDEYV